METNKQINMFMEFKGQKYWPDIAIIYVTDAQRLPLCMKLPSSNLHIDWEENVSKKPKLRKNIKVNDTETFT